MEPAESIEGEFLDYVREHQAGLRAFVRSLGVDPMWVDDIAQEAFIVAYERIDEFERERDFGKWVRGIARNLVLNERRKSARRKRILSDNLTEILVSTTSVPEEAIEEGGDQTRARLVALRTCLEKVPEKSRELLRSRYEQDAKAPDIALRLGMSSAAVRKSLERIRINLKKCMEDQLSQLARGNT